MKQPNPASKKKLNRNQCVSEFEIFYSEANEEINI